MLVAGIMSGTSLDGIDVAVVDIKGRRIETVAFRSTPYPKAIRERILNVSNCNTHTAELARLHFALGDLYAKAVEAIKIPGIELAGCHGQTIYHEGRIATLQIGEAAVIAERTGIPVVCDFRVGDIAAGGEGAPLVPFIDYWLYRDARRARVALNLGGIGNITAIPAAATPEQVTAFDTGPGNMIIDALVKEYTQGKQQYDRGGRIAAKGNVDRALLAALLNGPYYKRKPPKTAGREQYGAEFIAGLKQSGLPLLDLITTATLFTAATVADALRRFVPYPVHDLIVSGGGAHNSQIMAHLTSLLPGICIATSQDFGVSIDGKEALAFAVLAYETWHGRPSNLPSATGARHPVVIGKVIHGTGSQLQSHHRRKTGAR